MKTRLIIMVCAGLCLLSACKNDDWEFPDYSYSTVYFAYQTPVRTLVLGEYEYDNTLDNLHRCRIMARTGGMYENKKNIVIDVNIDESLCDGWKFNETGDEIKVMPRNYYNYDELKNTQLVIASGNSIGGVDVQLTDDFFKDKEAISTSYVIPMVMTSVTGADSILQGRTAVANPRRLVADDWEVQPKDYILYAIKYVNTWDGTYLRRGKEKVNEGGILREIVRHAEYVEKNDRCALKTVSLNEVALALSTRDKDNHEIPFEMLLSFDDNKCSIKGNGGDYSVQGQGTYVLNGDRNSWGGEDHNALFLDYTLSLPNGNSYQISDTLTFLTRGLKMEVFTPSNK